MLHKASKVRGFHIRAVDGEIGHVDDILFDEQSWAVRYFVVDTSNWVGGRSVLISSSMVDAVDAPNEEIRVRMTRGEIERGPSVETANIELIETMPSVWII